jgi:hypothetical protein
MDRAIAGALIAHGGEPRLDIDRRSAAWQVNIKEGIAVLRCGALARNEWPRTVEPILHIGDLVAAVGAGDDLHLDVLAVLGVVRARYPHQPRDLAHRRVAADMIR